MIRPNPVQDRIWLSFADRVEEIRVIDVGTGSVSRVPFTWRNATAEVDATGLAPGVHVLWVRSARDVRTVRFIKQ